MDSAPVKHTNWAQTGIFFILAVAVLLFAKNLFMPIVFALILALVLSPIRRFMNHLCIPSGIAAAIIMISLVGVIFSIGTMGSMAMQSQMGAIQTLIPDALARLEELTGLVQPVVDASEQIEVLTTQTEPTAEVVLKEENILSLIAQGTPATFAMVMLGVTLAFFLIASGYMFYEKLVQVMPTIKDKARAVAIARSIEKHLSCYLLTITIINAGLGLSIGLAMAACGMPSPILIGLMAFFLNYIPYVGALGGVAITFFVGLLTQDAVGAAAIPALIYWGLTTLEGQFLTPVLVGRRLKLNPVVVFLSLAVWAWLWAVPGMFLSTPILIALKALSDRIPNMQLLSKFLAQRDDVSAKDGLIISRFLPYEDAISITDAETSAK
jgi:predicted PurR-regulated permease PerM